MSQYEIVNESTEDTLESTDNLENAIRIARQAARQGRLGDPVSILEKGGKSVRQFVRLPDGTIEEQTIVYQAKPLDAPHS